MNDTNLLSSVALFSELYNSNTFKSIQDILAQFIAGAVVYENSYDNLDSTKVKQLLYNVYNFKIPESVVRTTLKKNLKTVVTRINGLYFFDRDKLKDLTNINSEFANINSTQDSIISNLYIFVEQHTKRHIDDKEKEEIFKDFCGFLLNDTVSEKNVDLIGGFIVSNANNIEFTETINSIKEGIILYQGIKYTSDINQLGHWNTDLTIYLGPEHLFSAVGLHGEVFKEIFDDFYALVSEINNSQKLGKNRIELKYFEETKVEIERFFYAAELIVDKKNPLGFSRPAMINTIKDCNSPSDIKAKKIKFDLELLNKNIKLHDIQLNIESLKRYNVEDALILEELKRESVIKNKTFDEYLTHNYFKIFNKINYLRKAENDRSIEKIGYIFITDNKQVRYLARNNKVKFNDYDTPFAENLDFIITTFWFKLKKGFSDKNSFPKSFDVVTKAKIILSAHLDNKASTRYEDIREKFENGTLTREEAVLLNNTLKDKPRKPEEITVETYSESLDFLLNEDEFIKNLQREQSYKDQLLEEKEFELKQLKATLKLKEEKEQLELDSKNKSEAHSQEKLKKELEREEKQSFLEQKEQYLEKQWKNKLQKNQADFRYFLPVLLLNLYLVVTTLLLISQDFRLWLLKLEWLQILLFLAYGIIILVDVLGKTYLFEKERIKNGCKWIFTFLIPNKKNELEISYKEKLEIEFNENKDKLLVLSNENHKDFT